MKRILSLRRVSLALVLVLLAVAGLLEAQTTSTQDREIQRFVIPGTANTTGYRVHASATAAHLGVAIPRGNIAAMGGYKTMIHFAHGDQTSATLTDSIVPLAGSARPSDSGSGVNYQRMPYTGSIMAVAIGSSAAVTAGRITARATILRAGGVYRTNLTTILDGGQYQVAQQERGIDIFNATEGIGCQLSTTSNFAPVTAEVICTIIVEF